MIQRGPFFPAKFKVVQNIPNFLRENGLKWTQIVDSNLSPKKFRDPGRLGLSLLVLGLQCPSTSKDSTRTQRTILLVLGPYNPSTRNLTDTQIHSCWIGRYPCRNYRRQTELQYQTYLISLDMCDQRTQSYCRPYSKYYSRSYSRP